MLFRWLESLTTRPCSQEMKEMGYLGEVMGIKGRYERCKGHWEPHLERSKSIIRSAMTQCPTRRKAVILGSGMLYDVPLAELANAFREVILVDVVHPNPSRWKAKEHNNVRLIETDVTECSQEVHRVARDRNATLPRVRPMLFCDDAELDLVISLNLLSQIPFVPTTYLRKVGVHSAEAIQSFAVDLVRNHIGYLERLPGVVAVISDVERLVLTESGQLKESSNTLRGLSFPWLAEEWTWILAPIPEASRVHSYHLRVLGCTNIHAGRGRILLADA